MQLFVRTLTGRHAVVEVRPWDTVAALKAHVEAREGLPALEQRLTCAGRLLPDAATLDACGVGPEATVHLSLSLAGGKGGFGANLRASGKAKAVDNFDACRDLQGRRIRHKTAAQKLEAWQADAAERELETVALQHLKEVEREKRREEREAAAVVDVGEVRRETKATLAGVTSAVQAGLCGSGSGSGGEGAAPAVKRGRKGGAMDPLAALSDSEDGSTSDDDDDLAELTLPKRAKKN